MPEFCGHDGYCLRPAGHTGAHTRTPMPSTRDYDHREQAEVVLAGLDWPAPEWADLLDDP